MAAASFPIDSNHGVRPGATFDEHLLDLGWRHHNLLNTCCILHLRSRVCSLANSNVRGSLELVEDGLGALSAVHGIWIIKLACVVWVDIFDPGPNLCGGLTRIRE